MQINRIGRDDCPLAIFTGPLEGGHEIGERLPHPCSRLEQRDSTVIVGVGDVRGHVALARPVLERTHRLCHRPGLGQQSGHGDRIEACELTGARTFDYDVQRTDVVVNNPETNPLIMQAGGDV